MAATIQYLYIYIYIIICTLKIRCACEFFDNKTPKAAAAARDTVERACTRHTASKGVETRIQLSTAIVYNIIETEFPAHCLGLRGRNESQRRRIFRTYYYT